MSTFIAWMSFRPNRISPSEVIALSGSLVERAGGGLPDEGGHHKQSDAILGSPRLSEALRCIGLPVELSHAYISRPIYAFKLVENLDRVVLFNDEPKWLVEKYSNNLDSGNYEEQALKIWKDKWMSKIQTRVEVSN